MKAITEHTQINALISFATVIFQPVLDFAIAWLIVTPGLCGFENPKIDLIGPVWMVLIGLNILWYMIPLTIAKVKGDNLHATYTAWCFAYMILFSFWMLTWMLISISDLATTIGLFQPGLWSYDFGIDVLLNWPETMLNPRQADFLLWSGIAVAEALMVFVVGILATNTAIQFLIKPMKRA